MTASEPVLNASTVKLLQTLREDGEPVLPRLCESYADNWLRHRDVLRQALLAGDPDRLGHEAHTMVGSSGALGAMQVALLCRDIEELARAGDLDGIGPKLDQLEADVGEVIAALRAAGRAAD